ncbi:hypothetical protein AGMMS50268_28800 [Spirochaetia bacterium]|nr:hypothetical protein AGMMS49579_19750 [Spirochaetia bacterium]GHV92377.1 hypothetical protein AGMMS50268_28800 [Spirochaetia bacterium]
MEEINNHNNIFIYKSPVGTFHIAYNPNSGKWTLGLKDEIYGEYLSTVAAADDVYCQATGFYEWDSLDISNLLDAPTDIHCWEIRRKK